MWLELSGSEPLMNGSQGIIDGVHLMCVSHVGKRHGSYSCLEGTSLKHEGIYMVGEMLSVS